MHWTSENPRERLLALILVTAGILSRVLPHPDNFSPVVAIALFSGAVLPRAMALTVPLVIMIVSDLVIGPHGLYWLTWGSFAAVAYFGARLGAGEQELAVRELSEPERLCVAARSVSGIQRRCLTAGQRTSGSAASSGIPLVGIEAVPTG